MSEKPPTRAHLEARFWSYVRRGSSQDCWEWIGRKKDGYGSLWVGRESAQHEVRAHRFSYELAVGPITSETLDHLCRNRACVNPAHLEQVSVRENIRRGGNAIKQSCVHGHPLSGDNLHVYPSGKRKCKMCDTIRQRKYRALEEMAGKSEEG